MAKSFSCCAKPNVTMGDYDRWTDNIVNVLDSPRARKKFNDFLSSRTLDDALITLEFWENCNKLLLEANHNEHLKKAHHLNINIVSHARFLKHFSHLVEFAVENVNFDAHQLRILRQTVHSHDIPRMIKTLREAQHSAGNLLLDEFHLFRDLLLKEAKLTKKK